MQMMNCFSFNRLIQMVHLHRYLFHGFFNDTGARFGKKFFNLEFNTTAIFFGLFFNPLGFPGGIRTGEYSFTGLFFKNNNMKYSYSLY